MKIKRNLGNFTKSNDAVTGIVVAILLIGLFVTIFSIIQTVYVPQWMEQKESEHMNEVASQFAQLKFATDIQLYSPSSSNLSISTPITLGSEKIPYLLSEKSYGELAIVSDECSVTIKGDETIFHPIGTIRYSSRNFYFVDQSYIYETGAVIIAQSQGNILSSPPFFSVTNQDTVTINFTVVNISSIGGKTSVNGHSTCSVLTSHSRSPNETTNVNNVTQITINTTHPNSWKRFLNDTLLYEGLSYGTNFSLDVSEDENWVKIDFVKNTSAILNVKKISAQITPGWIN